MSFEHKRLLITIKAVPNLSAITSSLSIFKQNLILIQLLINSQASILSSKALLRTKFRTFSALWNFFIIIFQLESAFTVYVKKPMQLKKQIKKKWDKLISMDFRMLGPQPDAEGLKHLCFQCNSPMKVFNRSTVGTMNKILHWLKRFCKSTCVEKHTEYFGLQVQPLINLFYALSDKRK